MPPIGKRLLELREQHDLTQVQLAQVAGIPSNSISNWERGIGMPADAVPKLAKALNVTTCELYGVDEGHPRSGGQSISDRFVSTLVLTPADEAFLAEVAASLERYRLRLRKQEGLTEGGTDAR